MSVPQNVPPSQAKFPGEKRRKSRRKKTVPASLRRMYDRALVAPEADIEAYAPTPLDLAICDAYLQGCMSHTEIAEHLATGDTPTSRETISRHMRDPVICAWIAKNLHSVISQRLGLLDAAMFGRALAGNVPAAKLVLDRYNQLIDKKIVVHTAPNGIPYEQLPTEDLVKIVKARGDVIDVTEEPPE